MRRDDLIHVLCRLTSPYDDFKTVCSNLVCDFQKREYEVTVKKINGKLVSFQVDFHKELEGTEDEE